jgi:hypothetical protein
VKSVGIVIADHGAAIVTVDREPIQGPEIKPGTDFLLATDIERLPFDLGSVVGRVRKLDDPEIRFVIDGEGLGTALWAVVDGPDDRQHWQLYAGRGLDRQALVDELLVAVQEDRFRFAPNLEEQPAMSKAMAGFRRQVKDDGVIGSELVVALLLAIRPPPAEGWFVYA